MQQGKEKHPIHLIKKFKECENWKQSHDPNLSTENRLPIVPIRLSKVINAFRI